MSTLTSNTDARFAVLQRDLQKALAEIHSLRTKVEALENVVDPDCIKMINWIDKTAFVQLLEDKGLMAMARQYQSRKQGDSKRFLDRLMRELDLFHIHEGSTMPSGMSHHVWRMSERRVLFHRESALQRFQMLAKKGRAYFAKQSD